MANTVHCYSPASPYFHDTSTLHSNVTRLKAKDWLDLAPVLLKPPACNGASAPLSLADEEPQRYRRSLRMANNFGEYAAADNTGFPLACTSPNIKLTRVPPKSPSSHAASAVAEDAEFDVASHSNLLKIDGTLNYLQSDTDRSAPGSSGEVNTQGKRNGADRSDVHDIWTNLNLSSAAGFALIATGVPTPSRPNHQPGLSGQETGSFATFEGYAGEQQPPAQPSALQPLIRGAVRAATACGRFPSDHKSSDALRDVEIVSSASRPDVMLMPIAEGNLYGHPVDGASAERAWAHFTQSRGHLSASTLSSGSTTSSSAIIAPDYFGHPCSRPTFSFAVSGQSGCIDDQKVQLADSLVGLPFRIAEEFSATQRDLAGSLVAQRGGAAVPFACPQGSKNPVGITTAVADASVSGRLADICPSVPLQQQLHVLQLSGMKQQSRTSSLCRGRGLENLRINTTAARRYPHLPTPPLAFGTPLGTVPAAIVTVQEAHAHQRQCSWSSITSNGRTVTPLTSPVTASVSASPTGKDPKKLSLYKTELCRSFEETGTCRYSAKCQFAHGPEELRMIERHPKHKSVMCKTFWEKGSCPYGQRCCFIHTAIPSEHGSVFIPSRALQCAVSSVSVAGSTVSVKSPATPKDAGKKREFSLPLSGLYAQENDAVNVTINAIVDPRRKPVARSNPVSPTKANPIASTGAVNKLGRVRRATHTGTDVSTASAPSSPNAAGFAGSCGTDGPRDLFAACSFAVPAVRRACDVGAGGAHEQGGAVQVASQTQQQLEQTWDPRRASFPESGVRRLPVFPSIQN